MVQVFHYVLLVVYSFFEFSFYVFILYLFSLQCITYFYDRAGCTPVRYNLTTLSPPFLLYSTPNHSYSIFLYFYRGLNADGILAELFDNSNQAATSVDVVLLPPDDDAVSDEDSEEEEDNQPKDLNHLGRGILRQQAELVFHHEDDVDMPDELPEPEAQPQPQPDSQIEPQPGPSNEPEAKKSRPEREKPVQLARMKNKERRWKAAKPKIFGMSVPAFGKQPLKQIPPKCNTPYDFHKLFVPDEFVDEVARLSQLYAGRKGRHEDIQKLTHSNIRLSHAIMYMTGYISPSNRRMYWELREDTMNTLVRKAMPRNTFDAVIRLTYFTESTEPDPEDRYVHMYCNCTTLNNLSLLK